MNFQADLLQENKISYQCEICDEMFILTVFFEETEIMTSNFQADLLQENKILFQFEICDEKFITTVNFEETEEMT